MVAESQGVGGV